MKEELTKRQIKNYEEFQFRLLTLRRATLILGDLEGNIAKFQINDTWKTAFPREQYALCSLVAIADGYKSESPPALPLEEATALYGIYEGSGPFVSQINQVSARNGFCLKVKGQNVAMQEYIKQGES
jgi:hypothetical protein